MSGFCCLWFPLTALLAVTFGEYGWHDRRGCGCCNLRKECPWQHQVNFRSANLSNHDVRVQVLYNYGALSSCSTYSLGTSRTTMFSSGSSCGRTTLKRKNTIRRSSGLQISPLHTDNPMSLESLTARKTCATVQHMICTLKKIWKETNHQSSKNTGSKWGAYGGTMWKALGLHSCTASSPSAAPPWFSRSNSSITACKAHGTWNGSSWCHFIALNPLHRFLHILALWCTENHP